jgi:hypothetical protein
MNIGDNGQKIFCLTNEWFVNCNFVSLYKLIS